MPNFKKDWMQKADIDYFSPFISLWLAFNSWYRDHYCDLTDKRDRSFINNLKTDTTTRNQPLNNLKKLMADEKIKENLKFKSDLESLIYSLNRASLRMLENQKHPRQIKFESALIDYSKKDIDDGYTNLIKAKGDREKLLLDELFITNDLDIFFAGLIEIIYQIRCLLIHGDLEPSKENHEVVKYCYFILASLIA